MVSLAASTPSQERSLEVRPTTLATEERLRRNHARLSVWERDMRQLQAQDAVSDATTENEAEPRHQRTLSNEAAPSRAACRTHVLRGGSQRKESPTARSSWHSDSAELRCFPPEARKLGEPTRKTGTDAEIDAAVNTWMEAEFLRGNPASLGERLLSACPQAPEHLEEPPGLVAPFTLSLAETLGASGVVGDCVPSDGARPAYSFSHACSKELLRMRQYDLVPPIRGPLQNFSIILAAEPTKIQMFNDTLELEFPLASLFAPFWTALRGPGSKSPLWPSSPVRHLTLPPFVPYQWRQSGPSIDTTDGSRSLEQVKKRGRWQVMKTVQRTERHSRLGQSLEALPERVRMHLLRCDEQLVAVLRDDPHMAHLGPVGLC